MAHIWPGGTAPAARGGFPDSRSAAPAPSSEYAARKVACVVSGAKRRSCGIDEGGVNGLTRLSAILARVS